MPDLIGHLLFYNARMINSGGNLLYMYRLLLFELVLYNYTLYVNNFLISCDKNKVFYKSIFLF